ncbi:MAG: ABC-F family ATP-binding cassette domain-containing protein [Candidatus Berkelbacteria bacterium]|nr:ABC-F family ATP-binding cassette domain-containing protein [Candidatus Berkelbacteria bacterium]
MLRVTNLNKNYGPQTVLENIDLTLSRGQKVALVGSNGAGKTTLLKIIAGLEEPDGGRIEFEKGAMIGYLPQDTSLSGSQTVAAYLEEVTGIAALERRMGELSNELADPQVKKDYDDVVDQYERLDGYTFSHRMETILLGFDLGKELVERPLDQLSSGQKSKVFLAGILLRGVDLLLLDEPTNNIDLPTLIWLEDFLMRSQAACLIVSHDRRFLDRIVKRVFELDPQTRSINVSNGKYSDYLDLKVKNLERQKEQYRLQQDEIERLEAQARTKRVEAEKGSKWMGSDNDKFLRGFKRDRAGKSSKVAKSIEKRIEQMDKVDRPIEKDILSIKLNAADVYGSTTVKLTEVTAGYDGFSIGPMSLEVRLGNRVAIMGPNGAGKSTLLKVVTGELTPLSGTVEVGSGVRTGNMMQEHQTLPRDLSPLSYLMEQAGLDLSSAYSKLAQFGIDEISSRGTIAELSPGGRARLILAHFSAVSINTLVLDEPTNHLDLEALEALEQTISSYEGSVILVSHDRFFLEKTNVDSAYLLTEGILRKVTYTEYLAQAEQRARRLLKMF